MYDREMITFAQIDEINQIISGLYDESKSINNRINSFFEQVNGLVYFEKSNFLFYYKEGDQYTSHSIHTYNWSDIQKKYYQNDYCHLDDVLPILDSNNHVAFLTSKIFNPEFRKNSRYFQEFLMPMGLHDSIEVNFCVRDSNLRGIFSIHRPEDKHTFTREDLAIIKVFQPHFSNVFKHYAQIQKTSEIEKLSSVFKPYNCLGIVYLSDSYDVIDFNPVYKKFVCSLGYCDLNSNPIANMFRHMCHKFSKCDTSHIKSINCKMNDTPLFLELYRISNPQDNATSNAQYMGIIFDISYAMEESIFQICHEYSLTDREIEILNLLLKGATNEQICRDLFISLPTVKKHIASIYDKLGINSQKQILRKLNVLK